MRVNGLEFAEIAVASFTASVSLYSSVDSEDPLTTLYKRVLIDSLLLATSGFLYAQIDFPSIGAKYFAIALAINGLAITLFQATGSETQLEKLFCGLIGVTYVAMLGSLSYLQIKAR